MPDAAGNCLHFGRTIFLMESAEFVAKLSAGSIVSAAGTIGGQTGSVSVAIR